MTAAPAPVVPTVREALAEARRAGVATLDAQRLLARALGTTRTGVIAHDERVLDDAEAARWNGWLERRAEGVPLAYLLGEKEFRGLRFEVTPDVLVPRPETELLVDWALERLADLRSDDGSDRTRPRVVDLGTGSGAIAVAIASAWPSADVAAVDVSEAALAVARRNAAANGAVVRVVASSWWSGLVDSDTGATRFDLAVANPPYIAEHHPALAELRHEPYGALVSGADGLDAIREVVAGAPVHLRPHGWLLIEHGADQAEAVRGLLHASGFDHVATRTDLAGLDRATGGRTTRAS